MRMVIGRLAGLSSVIEPSGREAFVAVVLIAGCALPTLSTTAYAKQLNDADAVIDRIISDNLGTHGN